MHPLYSNMPTTIFEAMSARARATGAVNLGQGFPDGNGPADVVEAASRALTEGSNQYPAMAGLATLRRAIAEHYRHHQGVELDWEREITVTSGATEALAAAIFATITPGDEVVLFQPMYDAYMPLVLRAGGVPRLVRLTPPAWRFDEAALREAFSPRTRLVIFNNPLNPSASMFDRASLELLARFVTAHDAVVVSDEVWEHIVFDGASHCSVLSIPELRERSIKIGSGGKIFALTGWKVGWMCAPHHLMEGLRRAHQFLTFTTPPNLQKAVAYGLGKEDSYFTQMRSDLARSRDRLTAGLENAGYNVLPSAGTYFLSIDLHASGIQMDDVSFCDKLIDAVGVAAIPVSAFYAEDPVRNVVRFCFAKLDATLDSAIDRMSRVRVAR